ncbi:MAG: SDR family oxidoreductase [Vicinamibacteria bacterium]
MILVTGAGGTVGTLVAQELKAFKQKVRLAYHSREKAEKARSTGSDAVALDFAKPDTLRPALAGIDAVFLLGTGGLGQTEGEIQVVREAKAAGVGKIVKLSVWGAEGEAFSFARIHRPVEREIENSGLVWTFLRPNGFMQNFVNYMSGTIKGQGALYQPAADAKISHIDARDIARVAAATLTRPGHEGKAYDLTGPQGLSYGETAEILSRVLGKKVNYVAVSDEAAKAGMLGAGIPEFYADYLIDLSQFYRKGGAARVTTAVKDVTGKNPVAFEDFVRDNAGAFQGR